MNILLRRTSLSIGNGLVNAPIHVCKNTITQANLVLTTYFHNIYSNIPCIISIPEYTYTNSSVTISLFYYVGPTSVTSTSGLSILSTENIDILSSILTNILDKEVHLVLTRVYYPYINAYILAQYLAYNTSTDTFLNFEESILLYPSYSINNVPGNVTGIKIALNGRLTTEAVVPRLTTNIAIVGSFPDTNIVDYASYTSKNDLGVFTIKVWLGQSV